VIQIERGDMRDAFLQQYRPRQHADAAAEIGAAPLQRRQVLDQ
jgi:hypothetical protein